MGNTKSVAREQEDIWWTDEVKRKAEPQRETGTSQEYLSNAESREVKVDRETRRKELADDFERFKQELARKHEKRRQLIEEKRKEMSDIKQELLNEKRENERLKNLLERSNVEHRLSEERQDNVKITLELKEKNEDLKNELEKLRLCLKETSALVDKNRELKMAIADMQKELQLLNSQVIGFEKERIDYQEHVTALKDVVRVTKEMLVVRENQIEELRKKINSIEDLLSSREMNLLSDDLRREYERQLKNIRNLKALYEERQRVDKREKENLQSQLDEWKSKTEEIEKKDSELQQRIEELEKENSERYDKIYSLESNLGLSKAECKDLQAELMVINQLFSQILVSFNNDQDIDLDKLIRTLEENHDLLKDIVTNEESTEVSALPKVLLDLVNRVNMNGEQTAGSSENNERTESSQQLNPVHQLNSPMEIVKNLPKVWRVLIELLSHQCTPINDLNGTEPGENGHPCYNSVQTPTGTRLVVSVSKTFIRLKDLILEKRGLEKEMMRLKQLNTHLEGRLQDQEKRMVLVTSELSKTWHVVGNMQKQHHHLHTQEKILRFELAQKRKLLTDLKEELEYCRQKWLEARDKNSSTEEQWKQLRNEFALRKTTINDDYNNSVESGYSDDKSSSDEEQEFVVECEVNSEAYQDVKQEENAGTIEGNISSCNFDVVRRDTNINRDEDNMVTINCTELAEKTINSNDPENTFEIPNTQDTDNVYYSYVTEKTDTVRNKTKKECTNKRFEASETSPNSKVDQCINLTTSSKTSNETSVFTNDVISTNDVKESNVMDNNTLQIMSESEHTTVDENHHQCTTQTVSSKPSNSLRNEIREKSVHEVTSVENDSSYDMDAGTSSKSPSQSAAEFVARREERMKHLEEQCNQLYTKVARTSLRGLNMSFKLDNLHQMYGENSNSDETGESEDEENSVSEDPSNNPNLDEN